MYWPAIKVPDAIQKTNIGRENQILSADIQRTGRFPVVDQGQTFIAGYSNAAERVVRDELPIVVFGDHTRCLKFVDFPFILGADGTKVLKPNEEMFDPKFFYFALLSLDIPNRGYNRHFSLLKEKQVPKPERDEQRRIATLLSVVQRGIEQEEQLVALSAELKRTMLHQLFTPWLPGESQKRGKIRLIPRNSDVVKLGEVCSLLSGGTPSKQKAEYWIGTIPWVSPKDMKSPRLSKVTDHISGVGLESGSSLAPRGSIFVVIRGMILAKDIPVALAEVPMAFNQDMKAIIPGPRIVPSFLLYALVAFKQRLFQKVGRSAHGTMTLMSSEIAQFTIPLPDRRTQKRIATAIEKIEQKHEQHKRRHAALSDLFRSLLQQLMTAQIRVDQLDLSFLGLNVTKGINHGSTQPETHRLVRQNSASGD